MKYIILLLFLIVSTSHQSFDEKKDRGDYSDLITINITEPINGYEIQIIWKPVKYWEYIKMVGPATLKLQDVNSKKLYTITNPEFSVHFLSEELGHYTLGENAEIIICESITFDKSADYIKTNIMFEDVDFDGTNELILRHTGTVNVDVDEFKFYDFKRERIEEMHDPAFNDIYSLVQWDFNFSSKELEIKDYYSCCEWDAGYYKLDKNKKFTAYKTVHHNVDPVSDIDSVTIKEVGKKQIIKIIKPN